MKFPDVSEMGHITIDGAGQFTVYLVNDDWEPDLGGHDSDHAVGGCQCPCWPPLSVLEGEVP